MKSKNNKLFFSYAHDKFTPFIHRLAKDLELKGYDVWIDKKNIRISKSWPNEIEDGIENAEIIFAFLSEHSIRRPFGICLKEINYAINHFKTIAPIRIEDTHLPLLLCDTQYLDAVDMFKDSDMDENKYNNLLESLLIFLKSGEFEKGRFLNNIIHLLKPESIQNIISSKTENFVGRKWLFDYFDDWLKTDSSIFWIMGGPGTGKSSFLAKLSIDRSEVVGIHFCQYNNEKTLDIKNIFRTLAYHISTQNTEYLTFLQQRVDFTTLFKLSARELFYELIVLPMKNINSKNKCVVLVDGVDEINRESKENLMAILNEYYEALPKWFGIVFSSRIEASLEANLRRFKPTIINTNSENNMKDITLYINNMLKFRNIKFSKEDEKHILESSEGTFQYVKLLVDEYIKEGSIRGDIPLGMNQIYESNFNHFFSNGKSYEEVRPILEVLLAASEPLKREAFYSILEDVLSSYDINNILKQFESYLRIIDSKISFVHKSIKDWLENIDLSNDFWINKNKGIKRINHWMCRLIHNGETNDYISKYAIGSFMKNKSFDSLAQLINLKFSFINQYSSFLNYQLEELKQYESIKSILYIKEYLNQPIRFAISLIKYFVDIDNQLMIKEVKKFFPENTIILELYAKLHKSLVLGESENIISIGNQLLDLIEIDKIRIDLYSYLGDAYRRMGNRLNALKSYESAIDIAGYNVYQDAFSSLYGLYDLKFVDGYFEEVFQLINDYDINLDEVNIKSYKMNRLLGNIYYYLEEYEKSANYLEKTINISRSLGSPHLQVESLYSLAEPILHFNQEHAYELISESQNLARINNLDYYLAKSYFALVDYYLVKKMYEEVIKIGHQSSSALSKYSYFSGVARIKTSMAMAFYEMKDYQNAIDYGLAAHSRFYKNKSYPTLRLKCLWVILSSAEKTSQIVKYHNIDHPKNIENIEKYNNLKSYLTAVNRFFD